MTPVAYFRSNSSALLSTLKVFGYFVSKLTSIASVTSLRVVSIAKGFSFLIFCPRSLQGKSYQKVSLIGWRAKSRLGRKVLPDIFVPRQIIGLLGWAAARGRGGIH